MRFLQVNFTILNEEFNFMLQKMKEVKQFKIDYEKYKTEWSKKVEASAGDVRDHVQALQEENTKMKGELEELRLQNERMLKEIDVYKTVTFGANFDFDYEQLKQIIEASEREQADLK